MLSICALLAILVVGPIWANDGVGLPSIWGNQGMTVSLPIVVLDSSFTALGLDSGSGRLIQGLSISVELSDPALVSSVAFAQGGVLSGLTPIFQTVAPDAGGARYSWIIAFDEAADPVPFNLDLGDTVGRIQLGIAANAPIGSVLSLTLDGGLTALSNQGGTLVVTEDNGGLELLHGAVRVEDTPIFADGFETGNPSNWTSAVP